MDFFAPQFRRDPNERIHSLYTGVADGGTTVTAIRRVSADRNSLETTRVYGPGLERGQGGQIATLILGGLEATLDEVEYIAEAKRQKKFIPKNSPSDVVKMCHLILERRNDTIRAQRKANVITGTPRRKVTLHLPVGFRMVNTTEPGLRVLARG